ncbi:unnamed protein product [marine sediment metagenome]|uniref:Uncharacterized protein n=1 Tax=marine sediment metagenome TaxID=412755 RepID=X1DYF5_9ZZZZ
MTKKNDNFVKVPVEATNYYLFSFQIHNQTKDVFEINAKLEKDKVILEFKIDDKTQKGLMKEFEKLRG